MINAGTARRNAGSAVSSRRYAGFAIDCASPLIESELTDALATSARAMPCLQFGSHHLHRKDVPHLSESLLIGIERWRFVERRVKEFLRFVKRRFALIGNVFWLRTTQRTIARLAAACSSIRRRHQIDGSLTGARSQSLVKVAARSGSDLFIGRLRRCEI